MANRVLRDWTQSEKMAQLSEGAELFFTRLIMKADDFGVYYGNPKLLKAGLFPLKDYSEDQILQWRIELRKAKIIIIYMAEGRDYIQIIDFGQRLRAMKSKFPQPADDCQTNDSDRPPETKRNETENETETNRVDFDSTFLKAFDEITCDSYKIAFKGIDLGAQLQKFRTKCDNDKIKYYGRDVGGLRTAFQYQLQNLRTNGNGKQTTSKQQHTDSLKDTIRNTYGNTGS